MEQVRASREPYNILFCLGFLSALQGAVYWTLFQHQWIAFYPKQAHAHQMIFGFLMSFISGFLMTAVPRMTGSKDATHWEVRAASFWIVLQWLFCSLDNGFAANVVFLLQLLTLVFFFWRRLNLKKQLLPEGFIFIPFAFISAFVGATAYLASTANGANDFDGSRWLLLWAGQAFILNLICGVGSRLIPVLSRLPFALPMTTAAPTQRFLKMFLWALFLNLTFACEAFGYVRLGLALRALWVLTFSISCLGLLKTPSTPTFLGKGLKVGLVLIILGYGLAAALPPQQLNFLHLVFIGGFSLMTFMVATRVVLAHGGQSTELEIKSPVILIVSILFLISGLARALIYPVYWYEGLLLAVVGFILAISLWMLFFGRYTLSSRKKVV